MQANDELVVAQLSPDRRIQQDDVVAAPLHLQLNCPFFCLQLLHCGQIRSFSGGRGYRDLLTLLYFALQNE